MNGPPPPPRRDDTLREMRERLEALESRVSQLPPEPERLSLPEVRTVRRMRSTWGKSILGIAGWIAGVGAAGAVLIAVGLGALEGARWLVKDTVMKAGLTCAVLDDGTTGTCKPLPKRLEEIQAAQAETTTKLDAILRRLPQETP